MDDRQELLETLRKEHRELDRKIDELTQRPFLLPDEEVDVRRMKKQKLAKKDQIVRLERELASSH
jgi:hypothetical protein